MFDEVLKHLNTSKADYEDYLISLVKDKESALKHVEEKENKINTIKNLIDEINLALEKLAE